MRVKLLMLGLFCCILLTAQELDSINKELLFTYDLASLIKKEVYSASKKQEKIIDAPLSISSITYAEIKASGARNILEALRLVPGIIIRETANGSYDFHIRGADNTRNFGEQFTISENSLTLVMINNRPVYDYFDGATFWETLPVSIEEIDKIEVIRGPSSALYGPNAVSGVINILTKKYKENLLSTHAEVGNFEFYRIGAAFSKKINEKLTIVANTNFNQQRRTETKYYGRTKQLYLPLDSIRFLGLSADKRYSEPDLSQRSHFANVVCSYSIHKATLSLDAGWQESKVQKIYVDNQTTMFSTNKSASKYIDLQANGSNSHFQVYLKNGLQEIDGMRGWLYDTWNYEIMGEHTIKPLKAYQITIGASARSIIYNDQASIDRYGLNRALLKGEREINNGSMSVKNELVIDRFRIISAIRLDKYNYPNDLYLSHHHFISYKVADNLLLRVVHSKANRSPAFLNTYYSQNFGTAVFSGNRNLPLTSNTLTEFGARADFGKINCDLETFYNIYQNFSSPLLESQSNGVFYYKFQNLPTQYTQLGTSLMLNYQATRSIKLSGHFTYSDAKFKNYYLNDTTTENKTASTPPYYGGGTAQFKLNNWRFHIGYYYISAFELTNLLKPYTREIPKVDFRQILNTKLSYEHNNLEVYINVRNILGNNTSQLFFADRLEPTYSLGVRVMNIGQ